MKCEPDPAELIAPGFIPSEPTPFVAVIRAFLIVLAAQSAVCAAIGLGVFITVNDRPVIALVAGVKR